MCIFWGDGGGFRVIFVFFKLHNVAEWLLINWFQISAEFAFVYLTLGRGMNTHSYALSCYERVWKKCLVDMSQWLTEKRVGEWVSTWTIHPIISILLKTTVTIQCYYKHSQPWQDPVENRDYRLFVTQSFHYEEPI